MKKKKYSEGQSMIEYVIVTSLVGMFCLVAMKELGGVIRTSITHVKKEISQQINRR